MKMKIEGKALNTLGSGGPGNHSLGSSAKFCLIDNLVSVREHQTNVFFGENGDYGVYRPLNAAQVSLTARFNKI